MNWDSGAHQPVTVTREVDKVLKLLVRPERSWFMGARLRRAPGGQGRAGSSTGFQMQLDILAPQGARAAKSFRVFEPYASWSLNAHPRTGHSVFQ